MSQSMTPEELIDKMQSLTKEWDRTRSSDKTNELIGFVCAHLYAIDARFFDLLNRRLAEGKERASLSYSRDWLFKGLTNCFDMKAFKLFFDPQCPDREIEAYLQQANEKSYFAFYLVAIGHLMTMRKFAEDRGTALQVAKIQRVIDIASRIAPQALPVADQYNQWQQRALAGEWSVANADWKAQVQEIGNKTMSFLFGGRKRSGKQDEPTVLSQRDWEIVTLADALLESGKTDAARAQLVRRGKSAGRVLALLLAGSVTQSKWWYWANSVDDFSLERLWKLEEALVAIGPDAAPFVRPLLHHPRWTTQFMAINTIGDMRDRESMNDVLKLLEEEPSFRRTTAAIEAIGKIGDPTAIFYLEKAFAKVSKGDQDLITRVIRELRTKR